MRRLVMRSVAPAALAMAAAAALTLTTAPAAHAVGENAKCSVNWTPNFGATVVQFTECRSVRVGSELERCVA
ncbi:hypothetical protein ACWDA7_49015 [Streptomyces sp. NPDC001156]